MKRKFSCERLRTQHHLLWGSFLCLAFTACRIGPDYVPPSPELARIGSEVTSDTSDGETSDSEEFQEMEWWAALGDPELERLIRRAVSRNPSLEAAEAGLRAARHLVGTATARLRPRLQANASNTRLNLSENLPVLSDFMARGQVGENQELFSASFDAAWEFDLFGGTRRKVDMLEARAGVAEAGLHDIQLTLVAEVARNYFQLRNWQRQSELLNHQLQLSESIAALARTRLRTGVGSENDVSLSEARVSAIDAMIPEIEAAIDITAYRLAVLCAAPPAEFREELTGYSSPGTVPDLVPSGLPGSLLRRRPDIHRADLQWAAATAQVGAQAADLYPRFLLTGSAGRQAQTFTDLAETESGGWLITPTIQWNLYQGGGTRAGVQAAQAERAAARAAYRSTVMQAVGEAETRLTGYAAAFKTREKLGQLVEQRQRSVRVAEDGFKAGVLDKSSVLRARIALVEAQSQYEQAQTELRIALAALNKALGGGWDFPQKT